MSELTKQNQKVVEVKHLPDSAKVFTQRRIFQVDEGHRSRQTAVKYRTNFNHFLNYIRIHDLDVFLDLGKEAIQELVIKYVLSMRDNPNKRYSRSTVNNRFTAILYFLDNNDIELNRRKVRRYYPSDESINDDRSYTTEEIQRILTVCDLRSKAMILLMVSSGIRVGSLSSMQIADLSKIEFQKSILYKVQVYARTRDKYYTFCTPECYNAIQEYLNFRKRYGEEIKDKSPLIREQFNKGNQFTINVPKHLTANAIMKIIDECLKRSGVKTSEARRNHAFRKGFKSICEQSAMKSINVEMLLGHDIGVSGHYYRPAERDILEDYMTHAADALTIDPIQRLQQENQDLKTVQAEKIVELEQEVERNRKATEHIQAMLEAVKPALDAKSQAAAFAFKSVTGSKTVL